LANDYNCRCWAEPAFKDPPAEEIFPELFLIPIFTLRRIAVEGTEAVGKAVAKVFRRKPDDIAEEIAKSKGEIEKARDSIEEYLGGQGRHIRNKDGDTILIRGDKKVRFDINNSGNDKPHFQIERKRPNSKWRDAGKKHRYYFKE